MKRGILLLAFSGALFGQAPPPSWWVSLHGKYLSGPELAQVTFPAVPLGIPAPSARPVVQPSLPSAPVPAAPQVAPVPALQVSIPLPPPTTAFKWTPDTIISGGGGYASPKGRFAYTSYSKALGVQNTYATMAVEYTLVAGQIQSCTFGGISKPIYEFGWLVIGLTGLGGGCNSTSGNSSPAGSAQVFGLLHFGKHPEGIVFSGMKDTAGGFKATAAMSWGK